MLRKADYHFIGNQGAEEEASALRQGHASDNKITRQTFAHAGPHVHNCFIS